MSSTVLYMSMSLDGYIAGPNDGPGNPGGDDFGRLFTTGWRVAIPALARVMTGSGRPVSRAASCSTR